MPSPSFQTRTILVCNIQLFLTRTSVHLHSQPHHHHHHHHHPLLWLLPLDLYLPFHAFFHAQSSVMSGFFSSFFSLLLLSSYSSFADADSSRELTLLKTSSLWFLFLSYFHLCFLWRIFSLVLSIFVLIFGLFYSEIVGAYFCNKGDCQRRKEQDYWLSKNNSIYFI